LKEGFISIGIFINKPSGGLFMHPEIEGVIRERAREYLAIEVMERGPYTQSAEDGAVNFDDIYFLGVCQVSEDIALDLISQREGIGHPLASMDEELQSRVLAESSRLVAELYNSLPEEMTRRWKTIQRKFASWSHVRHALS